jgi:hypothetical protein
VIDSRIQAVRERWQIPQGWWIPYGTSDAGASSQHTLGHGGPLHTHAALNSQAGDPVRDRERLCGQRMTEAWVN